MKTVLFLAVSLFISSQSFAQDPEIFDTWYLHNLILDGQDHIPNNLSQNLECNFYDFDPNWNGFTFHFPNQNTIETFQVSYDAVNPEFSMVDLGGLQLGICNDQACFDFFAIYSPFYFDYTNTVMTYQVTMNPDGTKALIITNIDGDQAIYNTEALLGTQNYLEPKFNLYPNPVSNQLFITSEGITIEKITVYSMSGKQVIEASSNENPIDVSNLTEGLYFIDIGGVCWVYYTNARQVGGYASVQATGTHKSNIKFGNGNCHTIAEGFALL